MPLPAQAEAIAELPDSSPRTIQYALVCQLLDEGKVVQGELRATWNNQTEVATDELRWHVYNNAFRGRDSVWLKEAHQHQYSGGRLPREYSNTDVEDVRLIALDDQVQGPDAQVEWDWVPQPGAPGDRTVMRMKLPRAIQPGESVTVELRFNARLAPAYRRNGWGSEGYVHAAQWYPKLGVFEKLEGEWQWNCLPYRMLVEYYSDYADFDLKLVVPPEYADKIVTSGTQQGEARETQNGWLAYHYTATDIHDFAFSADPEARRFQRTWREADFRDVEEEQRVAEALGMSVEEVRPKNEVQMYLLLQPEHAEFEDRYFEATARALYYFALWYGEYPYESISIVDPAHDARWTGGMEYPRLFTGGVHKGAHERTHDPEGVTVHEFGHQYWYGLVGTDEFRHAWMDEGFCVFSTQRVMNKAFRPELAVHSVGGYERIGKAPAAWPRTASGLSQMASLRRLNTPAVGEFPALNVELFRPETLTRFMAETPPISYWPQVEDHAIYGLRRSYRTDFYQPIVTNSGDLFEWNLRGVNTYSRPAMTLESMARMMGEGRWMRLMRDYHATYRYGHPRPGDWMRVVLKHANGASLGEGDAAIPINWLSFWAQAYRGNEIVDFGVHRVANLPHLIDDDGERGRVRIDPKRWDVHIEIRRVGGFEVPVEYLVRWSDGSETRHVWAGNNTTHALRFRDHDLQALQVVIDPERKLVLDRDWLNNTYTVTPQSEFAAEAGARTLLWAQSVLQYFGGIG